MKTLPFNDAVSAAKLLLLLGNTTLFLASNKEGQKLLSRLRGRVDVAVSALVLRDGAQGAVDAALEAYLANMHRALLATASQLSVDLLVHGTAPATKLFRPGASNKTSIRTAAKFVMDALTPLSSDAISKDRDVQMALFGVGQHKERPSLLKDFGSIVRNTEWMTLLVGLGVDLAAPNMTTLQLQLENAWGSRIGKDAVATKTARFISGPAAAPKAKPRSPATKGAKLPVAAHAPPTLGDVAIVSVALDATKLAHLQRTRELNVSDHEVSPRITDLLQAAAIPVRVGPGEPTEAVAQLKLTTFLNGLEKRAVALESARASAAQLAQEALKARALDALRKLGPLAQVLAANPELLKQV